jgi:hypothetical protein
MVRYLCWNPILPWDRILDSPQISSLAVLALYGLPLSCLPSSYFRKLNPPSPTTGPKMTDLISLEKIAQWQKLKTLVLDSVSSPITKRVYNMALDEFKGWFKQAPRPGFTTATASAWRVSLEDRRRNAKLPRLDSQTDGHWLAYASDESGWSARTLHRPGSDSQIEMRSTTLRVIFFWRRS